MRLFLIALAVVYVVLVGVAESLSRGAASPGWAAQGRLAPTDRTQSGPHKGSNNGLVSDIAAHSAAAVTSAQPAAAAPRLEGTCPASMRDAGAVKAACALPPQKAR